MYYDRLIDFDGVQSDTKYAKAVLHGMVAVVGACDVDNHGGWLTRHPLRVKAICVLNISACIHPFPLQMPSLGLL